MTVAVFIGGPHDRKRIWMEYVEDSVVIPLILDGDCDSVLESVYQKRQKPSIQAVYDHVHDRILSS